MTTDPLDRRTLLKLLGASGVYGTVSSAQGSRSLSTANGIETGQRPEQTVRRYLLEQDEEWRTEIIPPGSERKPVEIEPETVASSVSPEGTGGKRVAIVAAVEGENTNDVVSRDATVNIWVGAFKQKSDSVPEGVADESLTVRIKRPDGNTEKFSVTTGTNGNTNLTYDLGESNRGEGQYQVNVQTAKGARAVLSFRAGEKLSPVEQYAANSVDVTGKETTRAVLARDGLDPLDNIEVGMEVRQGNKTIKKQIAKTDEDGFASVSFTPADPGSYRIIAREGGKTIIDEQTRAADIVMGTTTTRALRGSTNYFGGYLYNSDEFLTDTEFTLRLVGNQKTYVDKTIKTDEHGIFTVEYSIPDGDRSLFLDIEAETTDGTRIGVSDSVYANRPQSRQTDPVVFRGEIQQDGDRVFTVAPGTDITVTLTATDDGSPITDQTVELFFGYQNVPVYSTTVKTDSKGTVTESISLPDNAPDGTDLIAHAMMSYEGKTHEAFPSANIRSLDVPFIYPALEPGTENEISYEVTDMKTGEPVEGVNTYLSLQYETARTGTFETGRLRSGSDGTDTETVTVPDDVHFQPSLIQLGPYHLGIAGALLDPKRPGTLSMPQKLSPGETVDVTFEAPDGTTATGFVSVDVWGANHVFGSSFRSNEQFSLEIPEYSGIEDFLSIANAGFATAWAIGEDGSLYQDEQYVRFVDKDSVGLVMKPQSKTLESGGSAEIDLVVTGAARGIGGYSLAATVKDVDILTIGEYTITGEPATSDVSLADDGSRISIDVDMGSNPHESGDVTVATLTVEAEKKGETTVSLGNIAVSDANGNAYDLRNTSGASVTVTESTGPPPVVGDSKPTDIDDDGKYEDIDGDGQLSVRDVQLYFQEIYKKRDSEYVKNNRQYFDYNDDGTISVQDLQLLFREYTGQSG